LGSRSGAFCTGGEAVFDEAGAGVALVDERTGGEGGESHEHEDENCDQKWHGVLGISKVKQKKAIRMRAKRASIVSQSARNIARLGPDSALRKKRLLGMTTVFRYFESAIT